MLVRLDKGLVAPELVRPMRAIEVLEWIGSPEARQVLAELAKGRGDSLQTREAKKALERLGRKASAPRKGG